VKLRWVVILVLLAAFAYGALWFELAQRLETSLSETFDGLAANGFDVETGEMLSHGFPHQVSITIEGLQLAALRAEPPLRARASDLRLTLHPWRIDRLFGYAQQIDLIRDGLRFVAPRADMAIERAGNGQRIALDIDAGSLLDASEDMPLLRIAGVRVSVMLESDGASQAAGLLEPRRAQISIRSQGVQVVQPQGAGSLESLRFEAVLHGRIAGHWGNSDLEEWRDRGGTLDIADLTLDWGDAALGAQGSLSLDEALRPLGALTVTLENPARLLDRLGSVGLVDAALAARLRPLLASLPRQTGGNGEISLPVSLQGGRVFLAGLPIARF